MDASAVPQGETGDACPLCGLPSVLSAVAGEDAPLVRVECRRCGSFRIDPDDAVRLFEERVGQTSDPRYPLENLHRVSGYLREMSLLGHGDVLLGPESARAMVSAAPRSVPDRADRLLVNLAAMSDFAGQRVQLDFETDHVLSYSRNGGETAFLIDHLVTAGHLDREPGVHSVVAVSVSGWGRIEQLRAPGELHRQGFVAMSFDDDMMTLYDAAIAPAIREAGYDPFVIAEHEHTGQIDDKILFELTRSRFVVAEFTGHRPNVYFEAGYALGLGLPVIWTCREEDIDSAHFDTRQYNHVLWSTPDDLRERLHRRIRVVVG